MSSWILPCPGALLGDVVEATNGTATSGHLGGGQTGHLCPKCLKSSSYVFQLQKAKRKTQRFLVLLPVGTGGKAHLVQGPLQGHAEKLTFLHSRVQPSLFLRQIELHKSSLAHLSHRFRFLARSERQPVRLSRHLEGMSSASQMPSPWRSL